MSQPATIAEQIIGVLNKYWELSGREVCNKLDAANPGAFTQKQVGNALNRLRMAGKATCKLEDGVYRWSSTGNIPLRAGDLAPTIKESLTVQPPPPVVTEALTVQKPEPAPPRLPISAAKLMSLAAHEGVMDAESKRTPFEVFVAGVAAAEKHHGIAWSDS